VVWQLVADVVDDGGEMAVPSEVKGIVDKVGDLPDQPGRTSDSRAEFSRATGLGKSMVCGGREGHRVRLPMG
jgi:hypothetical protein